MLLRTNFIAFTP